MSAMLAGFGDTAATDHDLVEVIQPRRSQQRRHFVLPKKKIFVCAKDIMRVGDGNDKDGILHRAPAYLSCAHGTTSKWAQIHRGFNFKSSTSKKDN